MESKICKFFGVDEMTKENTILISMYCVLVVSFLSWVIYCFLFTEILDSIVNSLTALSGFVVITLIYLGMLKLTKIFLKVVGVIYPQSKESREFNKKISKLKKESRKNDSKSRKEIQKEITLLRIDKKLRELEE